MYRFDGTMKCNIYDNDGNLILSAPASVADCNIGVFTVEQDAVNESSLLVTEYCPECETEVTMQWDVKALGYKAFCPHCGKRLMLCSECRHRKDGGFMYDCDYDSETDSCRFNTHIQRKEE